MSDSLRPHGLYSPWNSPGQNTGVNSLSLLQGIFPTQGLGPGLLHCRQILYQLSHKGNITWFKSQNLKVVFFSIPSLPFPLIPASNNFICDWLLLLCVFFFFNQKSVRVRVCFALLSYTGGSLLYILFCAFVRHTENNCTLVYRTLFWKNLYFYFLKESGLFINLFFNYFGHAVRLVGC